MPLYEYRCAKCAQTFEVIQKFSDQPVAEHAGCGGAVERLVSTSALLFKGSGWYKTDYAGHGKDPAKGKDQGKESKEPSGDSKSESKSESKTESKSEGKSETKSSGDSGSSSSTSSSPTSTTPAKS